MSDEVLFVQVVFSILLIFADVICEESDTSSTSLHQRSFSNGVNTTGPEVSLTHCFDGASEIYRRCGQDGPLLFIDLYPER